MNTEIDIIRINTKAAQTAFQQRAWYSGQLCVDCTELDHLYLPKLESVGELIIRGNRRLMSIELPALKNVEGKVVLGDNSALSAVDLHVLETIDGSLRIYENELLADLSGLTAISWIGGNLVLATNPHLDSISLERLKTVVGSIAVKANGNLTEVSGFPELQSVGAIDLDGNPTLKTVRLPGVERVDGLIRSNENPALEVIGLPLLREARLAVDVYGSPLRELDFPELDSLEARLLRSRLEIKKTQTSVSDSLLWNAGFHRAITVKLKRRMAASPKPLPKDSGLIEVDVGKVRLKNALTIASPLISEGRSNPDTRAASGGGVVTMMVEPLAGETRVVLKNAIPPDVLPQSAITGAIEGIVDVLSATRHRPVIVGVLVTLLDASCDDDQAGPQPFRGATANALKETFSQLRLFPIANFL